MRTYVMQNLVRSLIRLVLNSSLVFVRLVRSNERAVSLAGYADRELMKGHLSSAEYLARASIASDQDWPGGYIILSRVHGKAGHLDKARETAKRGMQRNARDSTIATSLGDLEREQGRFREAEESYRRALEVGGRKPRVLLRLARSLEGQSNLEEAAALLEEARKQAPDDLDVLTALGEVRTEQGDFEEAATLLSETVKRDPHRAFPHFYLGVALRNVGKHSDAVNEVRKALSIEPANERFATYLDELEEAV
jgi:Flp pilus assembly protein TadD